MQGLEVSQPLTIIDSFSGEWEQLSNFYPCTVHYYDFEFGSVEHAYQAMKSRNPNIWKKFIEIPADQPGKAKRLGRTVKLREGWELKKIAFMRQFLLEKFRKPEFRIKLLSTADATLIEGNYWHDNFWGDCRCKKCISKEGQNQLGKLLMKIREQIK